ncbi:MAG: TrmH family RNA methyltransferase [Conexivisphaerales archaeon]
MNIRELSIAMVEPAYSLNVGYVARVMKNFGLKKLIIVGNKRLGKTARVYAAHAKDIIDDCEFMSFDDLFVRYTFVVGTTAVAAKANNSLGGAVSPEKLAKLMRSPHDTVIVLGRDTIGLTSEELAKCDLVVTIHTGTDYSTLNISHALSILLYVLNQQQKNQYTAYLRRKTRKVMLDYLTFLVEKSIVQPHKRHRILLTLKRLIDESNLREEQVVSLIGFFRKLKLLID